MSEVTPDENAGTLWVNGGSLLTKITYNTRQFVYENYFLTDYIPELLPKQNKITMCLPE